LILQAIKDKLKEVDENTFYGVVDKKMKDELWNYIVFNRTTLKTSTNKTSYTDGYSVHIIREEWIPDEVVTGVINKMLEIDGMRLAQTDSQYNYVQKPNTNLVIEMLSIDFVRPRKA
jgi:hypothetical protein